MKIDYCKLTEDLLPLYADNLVSPETKELLDWHLDQCSDCRKKYLGTTDKLEAEQPLTGLEEDARYASARKFIITFRRRARGIAISILILFILFSITSFWLGQTSYSYMEKPLQVQSADNYAEKVVPGWSRAELTGQIVDLDITKPIEGTLAEVTFEKVWFNQLYTIVLYTIKDPEGKFYLASGEGIDLSPDKSRYENQGMHPFGNRFGGISESGMHQVMVFSGYEFYSPTTWYSGTEDQITHSHEYPVPESIPLVLTIPKWVQGPFPPKSYANHQEIDSEMSLPLVLKSEYFQEKVETIQLDQTLEWKDRKATLNTLEVGLSKNRLFGRIELPEGETNPNLQGYFQVGDQQAWLSTEMLEPTTEPNTFEFIAYSDPFNQWPEPLELRITGIRFQTSEILTFPLNWSNYQNVKNKMLINNEEQSPQTSYDSTIRIWQIVKEGVNFKTDKPSVIENPVVIEPEITGKFEVVNENGEILSSYTGNTWSGNIFGNEDIGFGFAIDRTDPFWKTSKHVTFRFIDPMARIVLDESITINP